jgi:hypothetical protein
MVLDQGGNNLYFGSYRELMVYSAINNTLGKEDTNVPGVVLAVSPDSSTVVINDQLRQVIYLYTNASSTFTSIGGLATRAAFSPDNKNVYIVGPDTLYVHNANTGWSTYSIAATEPAPSCSLNNNSPAASGTFDPFCGPDLAITVPSIGPFITGTQTTAHGFCPNIKVTPPIYYPLAATVGATTEHLAATNDGMHILGASLSQGFTDINVMIPTGPCPAAGTGIQLSPAFNQLPLAGISPSEIDQVVASQDSTIAFVTYNSTSASGLLPAYVPSATAGSAGKLTNVQLSGIALAPISGIFSPDETIFFVGTSGDNLLHFINPVTLTDTQTVNPNLVDSTGKPVPIQLLAVKPRSTT